MANKNLSESQYEDLKLKEIDKLIIDRIRKKSEKLQLENKHAKAHPNEASRTGEFLGEDADDYINLRDCTSKKITFKDFNIVKLVGKGSFGKVFLVTSKENTGEFYAMKALKKDVVLQDDDVECTMLERDVCKLGNKNPYLTKLFCTFQNEVNPRKKLNDRSFLFFSSNSLPLYSN
jgi:serine/threonine protein kinase